MDNRLIATEQFPADLPWARRMLLENPLLEALRPAIARCAAGHFPTPSDLTALAREREIACAGGLPLQFVPSEGPRRRGLDSQYEVGIFRSGCVPTRSRNLHDLFNALAWITFPKTKALLNRLHYGVLAACSGGREGTPGRGTARDVLTLFDEGGVIVACGEPELADLLRSFRWKTLFWTRRKDVRRAMHCLVFGHAIHEKSLEPYKGVTAKALILDVSPDFLCMPLEEKIAQLDARVARYFEAPASLASTRTLAPLPVYGIPGWNPANESEGYYDDPEVFRPGRGGRADGGTAATGLAASSSG